MRNGKRSELGSTGDPLDALRANVPPTLLRALKVTTALFFMLFMIGCGSGEDSNIPPRSARDRRAEAIQKLKTEVQSKPGDARAWKQLGIQLFSQSVSTIGRWDENFHEYQAVAWHKTERSLDEALHAFQTGLKFDSTDAQLLALAGHALLTKFEYDPVLNDTVRLMRAILWLERSAQLDSTNVAALVDLALAWTPSWRCEGDIKKAKEYVRKAMSLSPDNGMAHYALASLYEAEEKYAEALPALRKALDLGLSDETAYAELSLRYTRIWQNLGNERSSESDSARSLLGKISGTIAIVVYFTATPFPEWVEIGAGRKAIASGSDNPLYHILVGNRCYYLGGRQKALEYYYKAAELDPLMFFTHYFWIPYLDFDSYQKLLLRNPGNYYAHVGVGDFFRNFRGDIGEKRDSLLQRSRAAYQAAIALQPNIGTAYARMGLTYYDPKKPEETHEFYKKALPLHFDEPISLLMAANSFLAFEKYSEAIRFYERLLELDLIPRAMVLRLIGSVYEKKGDLRTAYSYYVDVDRTYPTAILSTWWGKEAAESISKAYAAGGNYDKGIEILQKSIGNIRWIRTFRPYFNCSKTHLAIGQLYSKKGDSKNAIAFYTKALGDDAEYPEAHYRLAEEYAKINLKDKAIESYRYAAKLGVPAAEKALQKLGVTEEAQGKH